jgi:hypothetical protein
MRAHLSLALLLVFPLAGTAADLPELVLPQGVGVNVHFTRGHERDLDLIAAAGFKIVRMDFAWAGTERKKGVYDWSAYDELTANLERRGLRPLYILDYSNALYEEEVVSKDPITGKEQRGVASPRRPESVAAFARWAAAAAHHYRERRVIWEIWNEPNISFWKPKPDVGHYAALALATCKAVRAADPQATLVAPATSEVPLDFLDAFFAAGALAHLDAVTVHPYRPYSRPPETAAEDYRKLRQLVERHAPASKKRLPILSGEWGYASDTKGVTPEVQAAYLVRQQLANLLYEVPVSVWYDWKNDGTDPKEREHNFGVVAFDLKPKPAYQAVRTLTRELGRFRITRRLDTKREQDYVLLLENPAGDRKLAAWTTGEPHRVLLDADLPPGDKVRGVTVRGEPFAPQREGGKLALDLRGEPQYLPLRGKWE